MENTGPRELSRLPYADVGDVELMKTAASGVPLANRTEDLSRPWAQNIEVDVMNASYTLLSVDAQQDLLENLIGHPAVVNNQ